MLRDKKRWLLPIVKSLTLAFKKISENPADIFTLMKSFLLLTYRKCLQILLYSIIKENQALFSFL